MSNLAYCKTAFVQAPHTILHPVLTIGDSGIGFGICQRLINEFLASRSLSSHLILIATTRSAAKSQETVTALRQHCKAVAETSEPLRSRAGPDYDPKDTTKRIHILSVELDLCNLPSIHAAARQLTSGTITCASDNGSFESLVDVKIPRLDSVIFNAGIGGWTGLDWPLVTYQIFTRGIVNSVTWPTFKAATTGRRVNPLPESKAAADSTATTTPMLGEVFCANVFGHYCFAHVLVPLLSRAQDSPTPPGRIIWESSIEATSAFFSLADFQAVKTHAAYESTKRLTDVLALTSNLPAVRPYSSAYLLGDDKSPSATPPKIYVTHPGVVVTTLFPLNAFLFFWYRVILYVARYLGSPWHTITADKGACAPVWLALQEQGALDAARADRVKWGSCCDRAGREAPKKSEVDGWGWDGRVEDRKAIAAADRGTGVLSRLVGRERGAEDLTDEKREEFEALGAECWREMERLRKELEGKMK